jgi:uncharacterized membrane protein
MATDLSDVVGKELGRLARDAVSKVSRDLRKRSNGSLSGAKAVAAGAGALALAPVATKGASRLVKSLSADGRPLESVGKNLAGKLSGSVKDAMPDVGGALKGAMPDVGGALKDAMPGTNGSTEAGSGVGEGRRMPVQQDIDIGVPLQTVYNQWTQFEEWPQFMHRLQQVTQEDESHVSFKTKIWGISKEFKAEIVEQRPDERIMWRVTEGVTHTGVVTFHELAPRLTRVEVSLDVDPGSLLEKAARGMRHIKRAVRADMARFKAYVLIQEEETGAWRGEIKDGDVKRRGSSPKSRRSASKNGRAQAAGRSKSTSRSTSSSRSRSSSGKSSSGSRSPAKRSSSASRSSSAKSSSGSGGGSRTSGNRKSSGQSSRSSRQRRGSHG